jgi:hypothetical protein
MANVGSRTNLCTACDAEKLERDMNSICDRMQFTFVYVDVVKRRFLTAATNRPVVYPPWDIWVWRATVEWYWQGKTKELEERPVPMPLCPPQIPHGLTRTRNRASGLRGQRLTAWAMARSRTMPIREWPSSKSKGFVLCYSNIFPLSYWSVQHIISSIKIVILWVLVTFCSRGGHNLAREPHVARARHRCGFLKIPRSGFKNKIFVLI